MLTSTQVQQVTVAMFGAAAGGYTEELSAFESQKALAEFLSTLDLYSAKFEAATNDLAKAKVIAGDFGLADNDVAVNEVLMMMNDGLSDGAIYAFAIGYLTGDAVAADFADAAAAYAGQVAGAVEFSEASTETDVAALKAGVAATVAAQEAAAATAELTAALQALDAANDEVAAFVKAWGVANEDTTPTAAEIKALATASELAVQNDGTVGIAGYAAASAGVQAALVTDQRTALTKAVTDAEKATATSQAAVDKVAGLNDKYEAASAAAKADTAADNAVLKSANAVAALEADVEVELGAAITVNLATAAAVVTGAGPTTLVEYSAATKSYALADGITEEDYVGITALVAQLNVHAGLVTAAATAESLKVSTAETLADADLSAQGKTDLAAVQALTSATVVNRVQMASEVATLKAVLDTAVANDAVGVDGNATTVAYAANGIATVSNDDEYAGSTGDVYDAAVAYNALVTAVNAFKTSADASNPLTADLAAKEALEKTANDNLTAFEKLVTTEAEDEADEAALIALEEAAVDAADAITDAGYNAVSVDGAEVGTAADDIFVPTTTDGSIALFGLLGEDRIYVGETVYNSTDIGAGATQTALKDAGDNTAVEFFFVQNGADVDVTIEDNAFGSSAAAPEVTIIKITGVDVADLAVVDGYITLA